MSEPRYEQRDERPRSRFPRWAKVLATALAVAALIAIVLAMVLGGGHGGPARHF
jgi:hypothetical protein